ncbi:MAG: sigma-70 family RNA polymerase sigma factor [Phycisphaerae bacterium]|nr:sigma-70 family RNA polymerase sigma factor [Phycisphaerae bacterium]
MTVGSTNSLLQRLASGDAAAMQSCMDTYGALVWSLARRFCPTASEAEDAVQEAFVSVWNNAGRFDPSKGAEVTFVAMIARRRLIDRSRKQRRRERVIAEVRAQERPPEERQGEAIPRAAIAEEASRAMKAMASLSESQQRVLQLAIHQGMTHEQIAIATDLPLGTVKTHARRGLLRIREMLGESASGEDAEPTR